MCVCGALCDLECVVAGHAHPHRADEGPQRGGEGHHGLDARTYLRSAARGCYPCDVSGPSPAVPDRGPRGRTPCGLQRLLGMTPPFSESPAYHRFHFIIYLFDRDINNA